MILTQTKSSQKQILPKEKSLQSGHGARIQIPVDDSAFNKRLFSSSIQLFEYLYLPILLITLKSAVKPLRNLFLPMLLRKCQVQKV